jgi:hypothetical protein
MRPGSSNANASHSWKRGLPPCCQGPYDAPVIPRRVVAIAALILSAHGWPASAQTRSAEDAAREREVIETLRREDPAEADRYTALSEARAEAIADLRRAESQYAAAGPELRPAFTAPLRRAQRRYAEASLALLDFFDARERRALARYQEEIQRLQKHLEDRQRTRAEFQKMLGP